MYALWKGHSCLSQAKSAGYHFIYTETNLFSMKQVSPWHQALAHLLSLEGRHDHEGSSAVPPQAHTWDLTHFTCLCGTFSASVWQWLNAAVAAWSWSPTHMYSGVPQVLEEKPSSSSQAQWPCLQGWAQPPHPLLALCSPRE